jgi:hypothetical protein
MMMKIDKLNDANLKQLRKFKILKRGGNIQHSYDDVKTNEQNINN